MLRLQVTKGDLRVPDRLEEANLTGTQLKESVGKRNFSVRTLCSSLSLWRNDVANPSPQRHRGHTENHRVLFFRQTLSARRKPVNEISQQIERDPEPVIAGRSQIVDGSDLGLQGGLPRGHRRDTYHLAAQRGLRLQTTDRDRRHTAQRNAHIDDLI